MQMKSSGPLGHRILACIEVDLTVDTIKLQILAAEVIIMIKESLAAEIIIIVIRGFQGVLKMKNPLLQVAKTRVQGCLVTTADTVYLTLPILIVQYQEALVLGDSSVSRSSSLGRSLSDTAGRNPVVNDSPLQFSYGYLANSSAKLDRLLEHDTVAVQRNIPAVGLYIV